MSKKRSWISPKATKPKKPKAIVVKPPELTKTTQFMLDQMDKAVKAKVAIRTYIKENCETEWVLNRKLDDFLRKQVKVLKTASSDEQKISKEKRLKTVKPPLEVSVLDPFWVGEWARYYWEQKPKRVGDPVAKAQATERLWQEYPELKELSLQRLKLAQASPKNFD